MKSIEHCRTSPVDVLGTVVILAWFLILGPVGALLLGGTAYFLGAESLAVAILCSVPCLVPLVLTLVWGAVKLLEVLRERKVERASVVLTSEGVRPSSRPQEI